MRNKTLKEIIALVDELNPNAYSNNIKAQWVNEVEAYIQTEIYNVAPLDVVSYTDYEESKDKELSLDAVNDKIYLTYLQAMIDFSNKEYQAFNNDIALYNTYIDTYAKWYVRTHGDGEALISGMYLSAYGIAIKHGFNGSEEEWIASLKGDRGEDGYTPIKGVDYWTDADKAEIISEIPSGGTWKTLIDTTLTEEQANVSMVKIEIPDTEALKNATRMKICVELKAGESDIASQIMRINIADYDGKVYSALFCYSNVSCNVGQTAQFMGVTEFFPIMDNWKRYISFYAAPTTSADANTVGNATKIMAKLNTKYIDTSPPYLRVSLAKNGIMGAGTKIFMEVLE